MVAVAVAMALAMASTRRACPLASIQYFDILAGFKSKIYTPFSIVKWVPKMAFQWQKVHRTCGFNFPKYEPGSSDEESISKETGSSNRSPENGPYFCLF